MHLTSVLARNLTVVTVFCGACRVITCKLVFRGRATFITAIHPEEGRSIRPKYR